MMLRKPIRGESRTEAQIREHYEIERELADRLRRATRDERRQLYSEAYNELFRRVPHHQQLTRIASPQLTERNISWQFALLKRFLNCDTTFLEIGAGDCRLSYRVCPVAKQVFAVDVARLVPESDCGPENFRLFITDGIHFPMPMETVDLAYSNQLMEHLHPDDAWEQLRGIYEVLKPGGKYVCITPNRLSGPWDISMYYDEVATGFHLKEYTLIELAWIFRKIGFSKLIAYVGARGVYIRFPIVPILFFEKLLERLPRRYRSRIAHSLAVRILLGVRLVGIK
jgi:SAM-dependent methyltransferase